MQTETCEAVVAHCIDFRFRKVLNEYLMSRFPEGYDLISIAGGVKELVEKRDSSFVLQQLKISHNLHQPKIIVLIQHEDCGAYGGSKKFAGPEEEKEFQSDQLQKAEAILKEIFPDCAIEKYFALLSGEIVQI